MNRVSACFAFAALAVFSVAQEGPVQVSAATKKYREYRLRVSEPRYGLAKVKGLIKRLKSDAEGNAPMSAAEFGRLSTKEKFTYCMLHGEDASQNCDGMPWVVDEEKKVFAYPPGLFGFDEVWSDKQWAFIRNHRTDVIRMVRETMRDQGYVGTNFKWTIARLDANELIPDLIKIYERERRDQDILTVLMMLMKDGKYQPFLSSATYRKVYGPDANYQAFIVANEANQKLMIQRAMAFYRSRVH